MRHLSGIEKGALVLAAVMVAGGGLGALFPSELVRTYPAAVTEAGVCFPEWTEHISRSQARTYGVLAVAAGIAIAWFSIYKERK
jgi:hypothetical protein